MYSKGDIISISFPFSDLLHTKKRPVLILAQKGEDLICCAITSNLQSSGILLDEFSFGSLPLKSKIKYWQIHTIIHDYAIRKIAKITPKTHALVLKEIKELFSV